MTKAVILIPTSAEANLAAALDAAKTTGAVVFNAVEDVKAAQAFLRIPLSEARVGHSLQDVKQQIEQDEQHAD